MSMCDIMEGKWGGVNTMSKRKPFNDVDEHMKNIVGVPDKIELKKLPKPLRWVGYFIALFLGVTFVLFVYMMLVN